MRGKEHYGKQHLDGRQGCHHGGGGDADGLKAKAPVHQMGEAGAAWQRQCGRRFERPAKYVSL